MMHFKECYLLYRLNLQEITKGPHLHLLIVIMLLSLNTQHVYVYSVQPSPLQTHKGCQKNMPHCSSHFGEILYEFLINS